MRTYFAVSAPGLEPYTALELKRLNLLPAGDTPQVNVSSLGGEKEGGVEFTGGQEALYRANMYLRTASRVLVRLGSFRAVSFAELRKKAGCLAWEEFLTPGQPVSLHATSRKSRLYHSDAVAERVAGAIGDRLGQPSPALKPSEVESEIPTQLVVVRVVLDQCTISLDTSGELLHRRGYRLAAAKAPLRETLAAGLLLAAGWEGAAPLIDPFCGSGTIAIEAAMLALNLPPGAGRRFAFMNWPGFDKGGWERLLAESQPRRPEEIPTIQASDRDAGAVRMAQENAGRAGVGGAIEFTRRAVSAIEPSPGPGWVVTNPPYGLRVSGKQDLRNLYAQIGHVLRAHCPGWQVALLCSDPKLLAQTGLRLDTSLAFVNGGVNVRLGRGTVAS
jgi:putative N6-adenine-specific DNA methylase